MNRKRLQAIYDKTRGRCWYCGRYIRPFSDWEIEHQNPRAYGGSDDIDNLVPACRDCNSAKGKRTVDEYRHSLKVKMEHAITTAYETVQEIEGFLVWEKANEHPDFITPPGWICEIEYHLHDASVKAVNAPIVFYGERESITDAPPTKEASQTTEAIQ